MRLDLQLDDSGQYTCQASSKSGETQWSAFIRVSRIIEELTEFALIQCECC